MNAVSDNFRRSRIKHFIGLIRVSTRKQADDNMSQYVQETRIREHVSEIKGAALSIHVFAASASKLSQHFSVLMDAIKEARETGGAIIVVRVDRLSRRTDVLPLLKGLKIYSLDEGWVKPTQLRSLVKEAEREAKAIGDGVRASSAYRKSKGQKLGNPINLDVAQKRGCTNNMLRAEGKTQRLVELFRANPDLLALSYHELSDALNELGFLNQRSKWDRVPWTKQSIQRLRKKAVASVESK